MRLTLTTVMLVLISALVVTGCVAVNPAPPTTVEPDTVQALDATTPSAPTMAAPVPSAPPTQPPGLQELAPVETPHDHLHAEQDEILYSDEFTDPGSGWAKVTFDNYFIGYHEPDYYHVDVHVPNDYVEVALPGQSFADFTAEAKVFADEANTAPEGDFRYGLMVRRSGKQYYAFTLSPRTQTWYVLKSSPGGLGVLEQGASAAPGVNGEDMLRVSAVGDTLTFAVNGQLVSQIEDSDYPNGELGFYVETFDAPRAHIHFDSLAVHSPDNVAPAATEAAPQPTATPEFACRVVAPLLNLRSQPDPLAGNSIARLRRGAGLKPLARSADAQWIEVQPEGLQKAGWVAFGPSYMACDFLVTDLPVVE